MEAAMLFTGDSCPSEKVSPITIAAALFIAVILAGCTRANQKAGIAIGPKIYNHIETYQCPTSCVPVGISDSGLIAGNYLDTNHTSTALKHGYLYSVGSSNGIITPIAVPGATQVVVTGISNSGVVVGRYTTAPNPLQAGAPYSAFTWTTSSGPLTIVLLNSQSVVSVQITKSGAIFGYYVDNTGIENNFVSNGKGFTVFGGGNSTVTGGNVSGQAAGSCGVWCGFLFSGGVLSSIKSLAPNSGIELVTGLSDAGQVAGEWASQIPGQSGPHGFVYDKVNGFTSFDPNGSTSTIVTKANSSGWVMGYSFVSQSIYGFTHKNGVTTSFDDKGSPPTGPAAIGVSSVNDNGCATASANSQASTPYAFVFCTSSMSVVGTIHGVDTNTTSIQLIDLDNTPNWPIVCGSGMDSTRGFLNGIVGMMGPVVKKGPTLQSTR